MNNFKKLLAGILATACAACSVGAVAAFADTADEDNSVIKYIKNSYRPGAYMYDDGSGDLKYGIPLKGSEKAFQWEITEREGGYSITNVETGNSIKGTTTGSSHTKLEKVATFNNTNDLWKIDPTKFNDEAQAITSATGKDICLNAAQESYDGPTLDPGYVISGKNVNNLGECKWLLFDEEDIKFEAVTLEGFCIGNGSGQYLSGQDLTFKNVSQSDYLVWKLEVSDDNANSKLLYNEGKKQYLTVNGTDFDWVSSKSQAMPFNMFASVSTFIAGEGNKVLTRSGNNLTVGADKTSNNAKLVADLAVNVKGVLGDVRLDGIYTFNNCWGYMYMLADGSSITYGNSAPDNPQVQWEVKYDSGTGFSSLKSVDYGQYLNYDAGTGKLGWSTSAQYIWKILRSANDAYPTGYRFNYRADNNIWINIEDKNGSLQCGSNVQGTWGTPHWEVTKVDPNAQPSTTAADIDTSKWYRLSSAFSPDWYIYQTSGGYAYGPASDRDARSHWQFQKDGDDYLLYNRNFDVYVGTYGNGSLNKAEGKDEAVRFGVKKYVSDGSYVIYQKNEKEYLSAYINIKSSTGSGRSKTINLTQESIDIKEARWVLEEATNDIETSEVVIVNTVLPTFKEAGAYKLNEKTGLTVEHYSSYVRVSDGDGNYLYVDRKGDAAWKEFTNDYDRQLYFTYELYGDNILLTQVAGANLKNAKDPKVQLFIEQVAADRKFTRAEAMFDGARAYTYAIYAAEKKEYTVLLNTETADALQGRTNNVTLNGAALTTFKSGEVTELQVTLEQGNNLLGFSRGDTLESIVVRDIISNGYQGATLGLTEYEFENGTLGGGANIEVGSIERYTMTSEASGRSYVLLGSSGDWAEIKLLNPANAITLRYSVPDAETGGGASFTLTMKAGSNKDVNLTLSSEFSHAYGSWYYTNSPTGGSEHVWFDEVTYRFDSVIPAGSTVRFTKTYRDEAKWYALDMLETEIVPSKIEKPENAISIADCGAKVGDKNAAAANMAALKAAVDQAAAEGKEVYIPEGEFYFGVENKNNKNMSNEGYTTNDFHFSSREFSNANYNITKGVTIRGAGIWYSTVYGLEYTVSTNDLALYSTKYMGYCDTRHDYEEHGFVDNGGARKGLTLANLWVVHYKVGFWLSNKTQTIVSGNRVRYMYADGLNFQNNGNRDYVVNNNIRSTGDDGIAAWSQNENQNQNITIAYNTVENPWHANAIAFYGGTNITIVNNICKDTAYRGAGVNISTDFNPINSFKGFVKIENNVFLRCGADNNDDGGKDIGAIWFNMIGGHDATAEITVKSNIIQGSTHQGVSFENSSKLHNLVIESNIILSSGSYGIEIPVDFNGNVLLKNNCIAGSVIEDLINGATGDSVAKVVNDKVVIEPLKGGSTASGSSTTAIALWAVAGVLLAGAVVFGVILTVSLVKKKED